MLRTNQSRRSFWDERFPPPPPRPPCIPQSVFLALDQGLFMDSPSKNPCRDLLPTTNSVFGPGGVGGS